MPLDDYNGRALAQERQNSPRYHTSECLSNSVDAFCDDEPDPGCICGAECSLCGADISEYIKAHHNYTVCMPCEVEQYDAALDAAEFNDPREQDRLSHEADLRHEYSKPEYHED